MKIKNLKTHSFFDLASYLKQNLDQIRETNNDTNGNFVGSELEYLIKFMEAFKETVEETNRKI